ncbi:Thioredoxin domain-containing protein 6 [Myotis davidii]|uniref:Thioredoxin domain-containing protein 6 n=1 Tax=Myotis davidii TaxID=225400 RepID=L5M4D6_MYODS|nr:Thioredoxin domain-containing protein 6 [Myotis davidii]
MGSKKKEIALQVNISTQELWEEMLSSKGLTVIDVYQGWCGPCKPVVSLFQKMRIEVGLDLLHFALAEADCLDVLEKYRGRCEPTFLFYAGGKLVAVVRGANAPLLQKTILDQLEAERKVLAEGRERKVIKDEALSEEEERFPHEKDGGEDADVASSEKTCTLAIIKPDAVGHGKTDEIIMKIQEAGFDIITSEERTMTEAEMRLFYQHRSGEEAFEKLVHHMCSGPSHLLILTRTEDTEDVATAWRALMGPCDPHVARREQPDSLRAQYGTEVPFNAVHGSRDAEAARRELALLFPSFTFADHVREAALVCGTEDWDGAVSGIPQSVCRPTEREEGVVGPTEVLPFPEDVH